MADRLDEVPVPSPARLVLQALEGHQILSSPDARPGLPEKPPAIASGVVIASGSVVIPHGATKGCSRPCCCCYLLDGRRVAGALSNRRVIGRPPSAMCRPHQSCGSSRAPRALANLIGG